MVIDYYDFSWMKFFEDELSTEGKTETVFEN